MIIYLRPPMYWKDKSEYFTAEYGKTTYLKSIMVDRYEVDTKVDVYVCLDSDRIYVMMNYGDTAWRYTRFMYYIGEIQRKLTGLNNHNRGMFGAKEAYKIAKEIVLKFPMEM